MCILIQELCFPGVANQSKGMTATAANIRGNPNTTMGRKVVLINGGSGGVCMLQELIVLEE